MPEIEEIISKGELVNTESFPDPWYGNNISSIYDYQGCYYRITWCDGYPDGILSRWASVEKVKPKTITTYVTTYVKE